jgi:ABC-type sugar transport system ATPase subunit
MNLFPPPMLDLGRTVGVRPENIRILAAKDGAPPAGGLAATVDLVEPLGSETLLHCLTDDRKVKVTVRAVGGDEAVLSIRPGDHVLLVPDMERAVLF